MAFFKKVHTSNDRTTSELPQLVETRIAVFIPAHNEENIIKEAVGSILEQTASAFQHVTLDAYVIADNCTDRTPEIVTELMREHPNLFLLKTENNKYRKSGALNYAFDHLMSLEKSQGKHYDFVYSMDADTKQDSRVIEMALRDMDTYIGGVCCRVCLLPLDPKPFIPPPKNGAFFFFWLLATVWQVSLWALGRIWEYGWWAFQNLEYSFAQSETVERSGWAHCLCGPGTLFRMEALTQIATVNNGRVWDVTSIAEDHQLTKMLQKMGFTARSGHGMFVYTDCPIGFKAHKNQRSRWNGGNIADYFSIGFSRHTFAESFDMGLQFLWFSCRIALVLKMIQIIQTGFIYIDPASAALLMLPFITMGLLAYRFRYVPYKSLVQILIVLLLAYEVYAVWYGLILFGSLPMAYSRVKHW